MGTRVGGTHLHQGDEGADVPLRHLDFPDQFVLLGFGVLAGVLDLPGEGPRRRQPPRPVLHRQVQEQERGRVGCPAPSHRRPGEPQSPPRAILGWEGCNIQVPLLQLGHTGMGVV